VTDEVRETLSSVSSESGFAFQAGLRLVGIDIGGTKSKARLWADGETVAETEAPSASLFATGIEGARAALSAVLAGLGLDPAEPADAICVGSAGLSVPGTEEFLRAELTHFATAGRVVVVSDPMLVLPAAGFDTGVALICGTGSVAVGVGPERTSHIGGWGYLLGDEGSGYWIVRESVRLLLQRHDQECPLGELGDQLLAATGSADLAALRRRYYEQPHLQRDWAGYARTVLECADPGAADIAARGAAAVAALASAAAVAAELAEPELATEPLPVALAGGLIGNARYRHEVTRAVETALPGAGVHVLHDHPVAGAVRLAAHAAAQARAYRG